MTKNPIRSNRSNRRGRGSIGLGGSPSGESRAPHRLGSVLVLMCALLLGGATRPTEARAEEVDRARTVRASRLVSLNPSLSAIVVRLGAGDALVGVDDYSARLLPELAGLPRVGGLFDPGLESIVSLRPDRVLLVAGVDQQTHGHRLEKLGLDVEIYRNERLTEVLENIERLGGLLDRQAEATARIRAILDMRRAVSLAAERRPRPSTVAVVDRSPLFVVGGETFLDEMLMAAGARNLGAELARGYPRGSIEWLISSAPELLLDMTPGATRAAEFWSRWPSLPAVVHQRVVDVDASRISLPGPDLDLALRELAIAVHGPEIEPLIAAALNEGASAASMHDGSQGAAPVRPAK